MRHVYQSSLGGKTYVPLENLARIVCNATPRFAQQVSSKYANMSSRQVQQDLSENHARKISRDYLQHLSQSVGSLIEEQEGRINYALPAEVSDTKSVSIGRDGTTMHISGQGYRETMNGTISFHNQEGLRLHTIYLAQAPQYGKADFNGRFTQEIEAVKFRLRNQSVSYIGLADGAADNWTYLQSHVDWEILDYWHACEYITKGGKAASKSAYERKKWREKARDDLLNKVGAAKVLLTEMEGFRRKRNLSKIAKESLETAITYFTNHHHQMDYATYRKANFPVGSGVTEAACKVIVKQRCGQSGMKWKIQGAQKVLMIRALYHTRGRWKQFWQFINEVGVA